MDEETSEPGVEVFRGSQAASFEFGLVLEAKGIGYARSEAEGSFVLRVAPASSELAGEELRRYAAERGERRPSIPDFLPFAGAGIGAAAYALLLILVAYCTGIQLFGADWLAIGAIVSQPAAAHDWWRPVTALTLHLNQEHLLGNLLFGIGIGTLAGRMFGPGIAWLCILLAGAVGNRVDMWVSPPWHQAAGASTAVFAALGMLAGFGWGQRLSVRGRRLYRWAPLFAGVCLLALLGAGGDDRHVDVLGHLLGFLAGVGFGWALQRSGQPGARNPALQLGAGAAALLLVLSAWCVALRAL